MAIKNGLLHDADEVMNAFGSMFNDAAQNLFNADYLGFDSKLDVTGEPNLKNVFYSTFTSDDADVNYGFVYDSTNDYYYTPDLSAVNEYVIIEADDDDISWTSNDTILEKIASGKWRLYGTGADTDAVKRAKIHKSLWYGTDGSNQLILDFTNITAIKTSHANDVGKRAHLISRPYTGGAPITRTIDGTFSDTTNNTDCSSWSNLLGGSDGNDTKIWQIPTGTTRNSSTSTSASSELGTDTSADENDNPANCRIDCTGDNPNASNYFHVLILCVGDITWSGNVDETIVDYFTDELIPLFTIADTSANEGLDVSTLIFKDTASASVTNCIPVINFNAPTYWSDSLFTNRSFEDAISSEWTYAEVDTNTKISGARSTTYAYSGTYSYLIDMQAGMALNDYGEITQTVDLTNATNISVQAKSDSLNVMSAQLIVDGTVLDSKYGGAGAYDWTELTGVIPLSYRTSGIDVTLRFIRGSPANDNAGRVFFDDVKVWDANTQNGRISVSADGGSNWTDVNNAEIARPTAGTDLWRRIVITRTDLSAEDKVTEQAVKYNLY
jgi:hypothetical protein